MSLPTLNDPTLFREACFVGGHWSPAQAEDNYILVNNPANDEILGQVPDLSHQQLEQVLRSAQSGFATWKSQSPADRASKLRHWYQLIQDNRDDLAVIMTLEQGKPLAESRAEIDYAASFISWFADEARRGHGEVIPATKPSQQLLAINEPVGVSVAITPWNFPAAMITRKAGAALAAGCSMVVKPSGLTPFSALALAELAQRAGIDDGVFNVVTGESARVAQVFTESPIVKKLSFTGSTEVGRKLMAQCAGNLQKLSLELGGNAPLLVFEDADIDKAVAGTIAAKFRNTGQTCICPNRFLVHDKVHDQFVQQLCSALKELHVGDGFDSDVHLCSLINDRAVEKVRKHFDDAIAQGAELVLGDQPGTLSNNKIAPTVLTGGNENMLYWQEETFGPLVVVSSFATESEAIELANSTPYGLASYFFSENASRVVRVSRALQAGMVGVNEGAISNAMAPFGGVNQSGFGREGGRQGMAEYQTVKYICQSF